MYGTISRAIALIAVIILPTSLVAQESEEVQRLDMETTVTATGTERDTTEVGALVTVIDEEELERTVPENVVEPLRQAPGVDVNGVGPNQARPVIRGQRGLRVLFLQDGLRMNNPRRQTDFGEISGLVDVDSVEKIELVRGPSSVLYGSDAIGGVLNVLTSRPNATGGELGIRYSGAGDLADLGLLGRHSSEKISFELGGSIRDADPYSSGEGGFGALTLSEPVEVVDTGVEDWSIWSSLHASPTRQSELSLRLSRYESEDAGFGYVDGTSLGIVEPFRIRILYPDQTFDRIAFSYFATPGELALSDSAKFQIYHQSNERTLVNDILIDIGPIRPGFPSSDVTALTNNFTDLDTTGLRFDSKKLVDGFGGSHLITVGAEGYRDDSFNTDSSVTTTTIRFPGPPFAVTEEIFDDVPNTPNATNENWGVFVQDEIFVHENLELTAGVRYHAVETRADATPGWDVSGLDFSDDSVVGAISGVWEFRPGSSIFGSWGRGFRTPNLVERLFNGITPEGIGFQILNADLESETSENFDIGYRFRGSSSYLDAAIFRNEISDGIVQYFLSPAEIALLDDETRGVIEQSGIDFVVQQRNADRLRYEGVELAFGWRGPGGLHLGGNYTHLDAERIGSLNPPTGDTYEDKVYLFARYAPLQGRWWVEYNVRHNGESDLNLEPGAPPAAVGLTVPSFTIHNLGAGLDLGRIAGLSHRLTVLAENLTDELYAEASNASFFRPEPGRRVKLSYRVLF